MFAPVPFGRTVAAGTAAIAGLAASFAVAGPAAAATYRTARVSVSSTGAQADDSTISGDISANGRFVVFDSYASNLVPGDTNDNGDVFVRDRQAGTTTRLSVSASGEQADGSSSSAQISDDGRFVTFVSFASNLVPGTNPSTIYDIYLVDRETGAIDRISDAADGSFADGDSTNPSISGDGRYVVFSTYATNLVTGGATAGKILVHDRTTGQKSLVDVPSGGGTANDSGSFASISANGRYVSFSSDASNLVAGDTNGQRDVFRRDLVAGTTTRVSLGNAGQQPVGFTLNGGISNNGRYVTFESESDNLVDGDTNGTSDVFVRDLVAGTTRVVSTSSAGVLGNDYSSRPSITPNGRYVTFYGYATNLVDADTNASTDVFLKDLQTEVTTLVSRRNNGVQGNRDSFNAAISPNGQFFVYGSDATNLAAADTNGVTDLYFTRLIP